MANLIRFLKSLTPGNTPPAGTPADFGRLALNLPDQKIFAYDDAGIARLMAAAIGDHSTARAYRVGDLAVHNSILYRCNVNIPPKAFTLSDWAPVSDLRSEAVLRAPTQAAEATVTLGGATVSARVNAHAAQTAPMQEWRDASGAARAAILADGLPNGAFGRPVFRVDQIAHGFTAVGQTARFDGTNWVLANPSAAGGQASAVVREIVSANALILQTSGLIEGLQAEAFDNNTYQPNTLYYASVGTPGRLAASSPPLAAEENPVLRTLTGGAGIVNIAFPVGGTGGGGGGGTDVSLDVSQSPNPFVLTGQAAAYDGTRWVLADGTPAGVPAGIIAQTSGNSFTITFAGLVSGIEAGAIVNASSLTPGTLYYSNTLGLLTATPPTSDARFSAPVLLAVSGSSGIVLQGIQNAHLLRSGQNLADLADVPTAVQNLGLADAVKESRQLTAGAGLTGGGDLSADRTLALSQSVLDDIAAAGNKVDAARTLTAGAGLTGGGDLSADRTFALAGQALAVHEFGGTGFLVRAGAATFVSRLISGGDGINVSSGNGLSTNPVVAVDSSVVRTSRSISVGNGLTGGGNLASNMSINGVLLTQAQVQSSSSTVVGMVSGQRLAQAIAAQGSNVTTSAVLSATGLATAGVVGSYIFARLITGGTTNANNLRAGSDLRTSSASGHLNGDILAGTWRAMGTLSAGTDAGSTSLWLRVV